MALGDGVRQGRERHPHKTAFVAGDETWTYEQFDEITDRIAAALMQRRVGPGDRVALHFANGPEIVLCYYACFKIGAVAVPLNVRLKGPELQYILNHSGARLFVGQSELFSEVQAVRDGLQSVEQYYLAGDRSALRDVHPFAELAAHPLDGVTFPAVNGDAAAVILYTSGTTARPKGVTHTHGTLEQTSIHYREYTDVGPDDVVGIVLPLSHIFAFALLMLPTVRVGGTLVIIPRFDPEAVLRTLAQHRVTHFGALPVMYNALVNHPGAASSDLSSLRFCLAGGDAVATELQRRFEQTFGAGITEACGMTEVIPYAGNPPYGSKRAGSIGPPTPGVTLRLVDAEGRDVPQGEIGEVLVKSKAAMVGYWADPEATAAALEGGWLRTGDLARVDSDGYYWFVSRQKEIIIRGGSNISPLEVEEVICQHPAVKEVGVVGVPDATWGEIVKAYVALKDGATVTEEELKLFLRQRIAEYKVPEAIQFLPELPKGLTGKIHRKTLKEWSADGG